MSECLWCQSSLSADVAKGSELKTNIPKWVEVFSYNWSSIFIFSDNHVKLYWTCYNYIYDIIPCNFLRLSRYYIYQNGELLTKTQVICPWSPKDATSNKMEFLLRWCAPWHTQPLSSMEQNITVPMYKTNVLCHPAGRFCSHVIISIKTIKAVNVTKEALITLKSTLAHGASLCMGYLKSLGSLFKNLKWGESVDDFSGWTGLCHIRFGISISLPLGHMWVLDLARNNAVVSWCEFVSCGGITKIWYILNLHIVF